MRGDGRDGDHGEVVADAGAEEGGAAALADQRLDVEDGAGEVRRLDRGEGPRAQPRGATAGVVGDDAMIAEPTVVASPLTRARSLRVAEDHRAMPSGTANAGAQRSRPGLAASVAAPRTAARATYTWTGRR